MEAWRRIWDFIEDPSKFKQSVMNHRIFRCKIFKSIFLYHNSITIHRSIGLLHIFKKSILHPLLHTPPWIVIELSWIWCWFGSNQISNLYKTCFEYRSNIRSFIFIWISSLLFHALLLELIRPSMSYLKSLRFDPLILCKFGFIKEFELI